MLSERGFLKLPHMMTGNSQHSLNMAYSSGKETFVTDEFTKKYGNLYHQNLFQLSKRSAYEDIYFFLLSVQSITSK